MEAAMLVFWDHGFEATSVDDLARAMGIHPSSLYATFGDKEALFMAALDRYEENRLTYAVSLLQAPIPARLAFQRLFEAATHELTRKDQPAGCMLTLALPNCSPAMEPLRAKLNKRRTEMLNAFATRIRAAIRAKELPPSTDATALARFLVATLYGMSLFARTGASRHDLMQVGEMALKAWPGAKGHNAHPKSHVSAGGQAR